jgi:hypothetical protein
MLTIKNYREGIRYERIHTKDGGVWLCNNVTKSKTRYMINLFLYRSNVTLQLSLERVGVWVAARGEAMYSIYVGGGYHTGSEVARLFISDIRDKNTFIKMLGIILDDIN